MKRIILCLLILGTLKVNGQVSVLGNSGSGTDYVGWDNSMTGIPLKNKTELTQPINFYTSAGTNTFNNMRMSIFEGTMVAPDGSNHNVGRVGITVYIHQ